MNFFGLYDTLTSGWARARRHIVTHLVAAFLLWIVGFSPPLPALELPTLGGAITSFDQLWQNAAYLTFLSVCAAIAFGVYSIVLDELGRVLMRVLFALFPPRLKQRDESSSSAWFIIAATMDGGTYEAQDLRRHANYLYQIYSLKHPDEFRAAAARSSGASHEDAVTPLRDALVFLFLWCVAPAAFDGPLIDAVEATFVPGLIVLFAYMIWARRRFSWVLSLTQPRVRDTLATMIARDAEHATRIAAARSNPRPYMALVNAAEAEELRERRPSLRLFLRHALGIGERRFDLSSLVPFLGEWRRFEWDMSLNQDYSRRGWIRRYLQWKAALAIVQIESALRFLLFSLGLRQ